MVSEHSMLALKNTWCFTSIRTVAPETDFQIALFHTSHFHVSSKMRFLWRSHFQKIHPPKKLPPLLGSFWVKTPWRVGLTVWVSHGCPSTYPTFFRGAPSPKPPFAPKRKRKPKKPPKQPFKPIWGCVSNFAPEKFIHCETEKQLAPSVFFPLDLKFAGPVALLTEMTWLRQWLGRSQEDEGQLDWSWGPIEFFASKKCRSFFNWAKRWKCREPWRFRIPQKKHLGNLRCWSSTIWCSKTGWSHSQSWGAHMIL